MPRNGYSGTEFLITGRSATGMEAKMATQIVMDHTGDTRHQFDPADVSAVAEAERRFKELTGAGFTAAKRLGDGKSDGPEELRPDRRGDIVHTAAPGRMIWAQLCADFALR